MSGRHLQGNHAFRLRDFTPAGYDRGRSIVWQLLWVLVGNLIFQAWWCPRRARPHILRAFGAAIGEGVVIRDHVRVHWPWKLTVADDVWIGEGAWLLNLEPLTVGHDTCISQDALICTGSHDRRSANFAFTNQPITIGNHCWVAARAVVLAGSVIPDQTTVPAGSVYSSR